MNDDRHGNVSHGLRRRTNGEAHAHAHAHMHTHTHTHTRHRAQRLRHTFAGALSKAALRAFASVGALLWITNIAHAQSAQVQPLPAPVAIGDSTDAWLALQRSNREAAPMQPMLGAEAGLAYQRYLDSFKTKIPASFASATDGGNGANQLHVDYTNAGSHN